MSDNPYAPPTSELRNLVHNKDAKFGSLESGIQGEYDFDIGELFKEAWELQNGNKGRIWAGMILLCGIVFGIGAMVGFALETTTGEESLGVALFSQLLVTMVMLPMSVGIFMMAIKIASGLDTNYGEIFSYFNSAPKLLALYILQMIFTYVGLIFLLIPGFYLMMAYQLALPLAVEKNVSPWKALESSRKAITHRWFAYTGLSMLVGMVIVFSAFTVVGLFWTMPWGILVLGILYRKIFGCEEVRAASESVIEPPASVPLVPTIPSSEPPSDTPKEG